MGTGAIYYSYFNTFGYALAGLVFFAESKRRGYSFEIITYILLGALLGALVGSRLGAALFVYRDYYAQHPVHLLIPQVGGKTLVGGLIGGYIGTVITKRILKFERSTGDLFAPALALGISVGRIGCFFNGCCYGIQTATPWGVKFGGVVRHPTQIYESFFCLVLFVVLWSIRNRIKREGDLFKIFLLAYTFFRFWIEFIRGDRVPAAGSLSLAQWVSLAAFFFIVTVFCKRRASDKVPHE